MSTPTETARDRPSPPAVETHEWRAALAALQAENAELREERAKVETAHRISWEMERERATAAEGERDRLREALGMDQPWPLLDVLDKLSYAARHLLNGHGYDAVGWEQLDAAIMAGIGYTTKLRSYLAAIPHTEGEASAPPSGTVAWPPETTSKPPMNSTVAPDENK